VAGSFIGVTDRVLTLQLHLLFITRDSHMTSDPTESNFIAIFDRIV